MAYSSTGEGIDLGDWYNGVEMTPPPADPSAPVVDKSTPTGPYPATSGNPFAFPSINWSDPSALNNAITTGYSAAYGRSPSPGDLSYWTGKWPELTARGQELNDPEYAWKRLLGYEAGGGDAALYGPYAAGSGYTAGSGGLSGISAPAVDPSVWTTPFSGEFTPPSFAPLPAVPSAPTIADVGPPPTPPTITAPAAPSFTVAGQPTTGLSGDVPDRSQTPQYPAIAPGDPNSVALPALPTAPTIQLPEAPTAPTIQLPEAPQFSFAPPTADDLYRDPSFAFRVNQGRTAIERAAAAKGILNTGGTLQDILDYGQNAATQEYGNVWNRSFAAANAAFQPKLTEYSTKANAAAQDASMAEQAALEAYRTKANAAGQNASMANEIGLTGYTTEANAIVQAAKDAYAAKVAAATANANFIQEANLTGYNAKVGNAQQNASMANQNALTGYTTTANATQTNNALALQNAWQAYLQKYEAWRNFSNDTWGRTYQALTA